MFGLSAAIRVYLATEPADTRKSFFLFCGRRTGARPRMRRYSWRLAVEAPQRIARSCRPPQLADGRLRCHGPADVPLSESTFPRERRRTGSVR